MSAGANSNSGTYRLTRRKFLGVATATALLPLAGRVGAFEVMDDWRFLTPAEAVLLNALCERIIPTDQDPGAAWANVAHFIDNKLVGFYREYQALYRNGLAAVEQSSRTLHGKSLIELTAAQQDELLTRLEGGQLPADAWNGVDQKKFFDRLVDHTMQGFYGPPRHGGNREAISWRMLGLPEPPIRSRRPTEAVWAPRPVSTGPKGNP